MSVAFEQAKETAVAYIGLNRNRSSGKVRARLQASSYSEDVIDDVIIYLQSIDYIDDYRAGMFLLKKHRGRQAKSRARLSDLLFAQGIPGNVAIRLLAESPPDDERALDLLQSAFPHGASFETMYKKLIARGFHPDLAVAIARKQVDQASSE